MMKQFHSGKGSVTPKIIDSSLLRFFTSLAGHILYWLIIVILVVPMTLIDVGMLIQNRAKRLDVQ